MKLATLVLLAAAIGAAGCRSGKRPGNAEPKPLRQTTGKPETTTIPALEAGEDEGLTFAIETTRSADPAGRRLRLLLGGGEATLTLFDPAGAKDGDEVAFGRGALRAPDHARGGAVVAAVARWLGQKVPAAPTAAGELRPFPISYVAIGTQHGWECNKLFLEDGRLDAELFLNVRLDGKQARFVEKDDEYRKPLVALLAGALRDGRPPRKTSGAQLASATPVVPSLAPIGGSHGVQEPQVWMGGTWIAALAGDEKQKVLYWNSLEKDPRALAEVTGSVARLAPSPRHDRVALLVLHGKQPGSVSSEDPGEILVAPINGDPVRSLVASSDEFSPGMLSNLVWSPDGATLAIDGRVPGKQPHPTLTRVYDAASGRLLASTPAETPGPAPKRWDGEALVLRQWTKTGERTLRWRPGEGPPSPARPDAVSLRSPDGRYTLAFRGAGVDISGPGGHRRFDTKSEGDRAAVGALREDPGRVSWLGSGALVLMSDEPMALDLATGKLRYLFADGDLQFVSASDDGERVVARSPNQRLLWGRVAR